MPMFMIDTEMIRYRNKYKQWKDFHLPEGEQKIKRLKILGGMIEFWIVQEDYDIWGCYIKGYKEVQLSNANTEEEAKNICWKYFEELIDKEWNNETFSTEVRNGRRVGVVTITP